VVTLSLGNRRESEAGIVAKFALYAPFDAVYSISVLAHMPRVVREENLATMYYPAVQTGILLLAMDVLLSTDALWKRSESLEVEPPI
jgi:hypothetical protein